MRPTTSRHDQTPYVVDIASGYFEIGALLSLDGHWKEPEHIRLLMGNEISLRTKRAFEEGLPQISTRLDQSIEARIYRKEIPCQGLCHAWQARCDRFLCADRFQ